MTDETTAGPESLLGRASRERHAQHDGRWFRVWVGLNFARFYLGVAAGTGDATLGLGFVYIGIGGYDRA